MEATVEYVKGFGGIFIEQMTIKLGVISIEVIFDFLVAIYDRTESCCVQ